MKYKLAFEEALAVFTNPDAVRLPAGPDNYGGHRCGVTGAINRRLFTVIATDRDTTSWIISARPASRKEYRLYVESR